MAEEMTRTLLAIAILTALTACSRGPATEDLYTAKAFVTGRDERYRDDGFRQSLADVLVKVSGDPALTTDPGLAPLLPGAAAAVASYDYHDRMEGLPIGDEQGTRDRPFDLRVTFKHDAIDRMLKSLGSAPWTGSRPPVAVVLGVGNHGREYVLASEGERGLDQRDSLKEAAWGTGLTVTLPASGDIERLGLTAQSLRTGGVRGAEAAARTEGGGAALVGSIVWNDGFIGWHADWTLIWKGASHHWTIEDVSFDEAFRNALRGAAQVMSGHGEPASVAPAKHA